MLALLLSIGSQGLAQQVKEYTSLLTDRQLCLSGDILRFTAIHSQSVETPMRLSSTLYVELLDGTGNAVIQQKHHIPSSGRVYGVLELPEILPSGGYFLRAYSQIQRNDPPEAHAHQLLFLINPDDQIPPIHAQVIPESSFSSVRFEAGSFVSGLTNRVVVQGDQENELWSSAILKTQIGPYKLLEVSRLKEGTSPFSPDNQTMLAEVRATEETTEITLFPTSSQMQVETFRIREYDRHFREIDSYDHSHREEGLTFVLTSQDTRYFRVFGPDKQSLFAGGILPLLQVKTEDPMVLKGAESTLSLTPHPQAAVVVRKQIPISTEMILDAAWTNPWLIPHLQAPDSLTEILEVLYLNFLNTEFPEADSEERVWLPDSRDLSITGKVRQQENGEGIPNIRIMASVIGEFPQIHAIRSDEAGEFSIPLRQLEGQESIFLGINQDFDKRYELTVYQSFRPEKPLVHPVPIQPTTAFHQVVEEMFLDRQLRAHFPQQKETVLIPPTHPVNLPWNLGAPDVTIDLSDFIDLPTMKDVIDNILPKVTLIEDDGIPALTVYEDRTLAIHKDPLVLLDGVPVFQIEELLTLSPSFIERVQIHQSPYFLGDERFGGIISFLTQTDDFAGYQFGGAGFFFQLTTRQPDPGIAETNPASLSPYSPDYRQILHWNPVQTQGGDIQHSDLDGPWEILQLLPDERGHGFLTSRRVSTTQK